MTDSKPSRVAVCGCSGRMGSLIIEETLKDAAHFELIGGLEHGGHPQIGQLVPGSAKARIFSDARELFQNADLAIDFSTPEGSLAHAEAAADKKIPLVIGTTGFTPEQFTRLQEIAKRTPLFWSPNMSIGIVIVRRAISSVSKLLFDFGLGQETKVSISETHHTKKKDSPSGTAKALAQELLKATGWLIRDEEIEAKREGDVIGIHSVTFDTGAEKISLLHEAKDRRVFAQGAVLVARHLDRIITHQGKGFYGMDDFITAMQKV